jgi:hypothetical protein
MSWHYEQSAAWNVNESPAWDGVDRWMDRALSHVFGKYRDEPDGHVRYLMNVEHEVEEMFDSASAAICSHAAESLR